MIALLLSAAILGSGASSEYDAPRVQAHNGDGYVLSTPHSVSIERRGPVLKSATGDVDGDGRDEFVLLLDRGGPASEVTADAWDLYPGLPPRLLIHCSDYVTRDGDVVGACASEFRDRHTPSQALQQADLLWQHIVVEPVPNDSEIAYIGFPNWLNSIRYALANADVGLGEAANRQGQMPLATLDTLRARREHLVDSTGVVD